MDLWCCWRIYAFLNEIMMIYDACWLFFMVFGWCMMKQYWETYSLQTGQSLLNLKGKSLIQMGKFPLQIVKIPQGISFDGCTNHILLWYSWYSHPPTIFIYNYIYIYSHQMPQEFERKLGKWSNLKTPPDTGGVSRVVSNFNLGFNHGLSCAQAPGFCPCV